MFKSAMTKMAIYHMNSQHKEALELFALSVKPDLQISEIKLKNINKKGLYIVINKKDLILYPFDESDDLKDLKNTVIKHVKLAREKAPLKGISEEASENLEKEINDFKNEFKSVMISSLTPENKPFSSYAPFIQKGGNFYIYISQIAQHYENVTTNPYVDAFFVQDESKAPTVFLRKRLRYACDVQLIDKESSEYNEAMKEFQKEFVGVAKQVGSFNDFYLFKLIPKEGRFVKGFGQAYDLTLNDQKQWVCERALSGVKDRNHEFMKQTA